MELLTYLVAVVVDDAAAVLIVSTFSCHRNNYLLLVSRYL